MRSILIFLAALFSIAGFGQTITTEVIVTNTPASGFNWTFAGSFRYWTNARTATTIDTNTVTDVNYAATNLYTQIALSVYTDPTYGSFRVQRGATNSIKLLGPPGLVPSISQNSNWIRWVFTTNGSQPGTNISVPAVKMYPVASNRTNILGQLQSDIVDYGAAGKLYPTNDARLGNYVGRGNYPQTLLGALTLNQIAGGTNRGILYGGTNNGTAIQGGSASNLSAARIFVEGSNYIAFSNSVGVAQALKGGGLRFLADSTTNFTTISADVNDPWANYSIYSNGVWLGFADVSPYASFVSPLLLNIGSAFKLFPILDATLFPPSGQVTNHWLSTNDFGGGINATNASFVNLNTVNVGASNVAVQSFNATNGTFNGTNIFKGSIAYPWYSLSTIGAGNNIAVPLGTNVYIALSGNTNAAALCGFTGGQNGLTYRLLNRSAYAMSLSQNTIDPVPANRIVGNISGDLSFDPGVWVDIVWDESVSKYRFVVPTAAGTNYVTTGRSDTNLNVWASSSNNVALSVHAFVNQQSNLIEFMDVNTNVLTAFGPQGGLHIGGASAAGSNNLVVEGTVIVKGALQGQSTLNVSGAASVSSLTSTNGVIGQSTASITGASFFGGDVTETNNVFVGGNENVTGALKVGGVITATNTIVGQVGENLTGALAVGGTITASNTIVGQVGENLTGALAVGGVLTATNTIVGQVGENLTGALAVGGGIVSTSTVSAVGVNLTNNSSLSLSTNATAADVFLARGNAPGTLAQRNGVNPQTNHLYNTYTDDGNYERFASKFQANVLYLKTEAAGSGSQRQIVLDGAAVNFYTGGAARFQVNSSGHLLCSADNVSDMGASAANRPRTIYVGTSVVTPIAQLNRTANYTVSANEPGTFINNSGATLVTTNTLPASAIGLHYNFVTVTAKTNSIVANGTDTIRNGASVSIAGGMVYSSTIGSTIHLFCPVTGQWFADSVNGTWVVQ